MPKRFRNRSTKIKSISKTFWKYCPNAHQALALLTLVLAIITFFALRETRKALVASQRAWIVPTGAKIDGAIELNVPFRFKITFENVGREVALNTIHIWGASKPFDIPGDAAGIPYVDPAKVNWPPAIECPTDSRPFGAGRSIYPGGKYEDIRYVFGSGPSPEFLITKAGFWVAGCFIYESFGVTRRSPYCLYFQPHRDRPIEHSTFEFCPVASGPAD